jgi:hypothetical protein
MNGWAILSIVCAVLSVIFAILAGKERGIVVSVLTFLAIVGAILLIAVSITLPLLGKKDVLYFKSLETTVKYVGPVTGYEELVEPVAEVNVWLDEAKSDLDKYGIFSRYYKTDVKELEPIVIPE